MATDNTRPFPGSRPDLGGTLGQLLQSNPLGLNAQNPAGFTPVGTGFSEQAFAQVRIANITNPLASEQSKIANLLLLGQDILALENDPGLDALRGPPILGGPGVGTLPGSISTGDIGNYLVESRPDLLQDLFNAFGFQQDPAQVVGAFVSRQPFELTGPSPPKDIGSFSGREIARSIEAAGIDPNSPQGRELVKQETTRRLNDPNYTPSRFANTGIPADFQAVSIQGLNTQGGAPVNDLEKLNQAFQQAKSQNPNLTQDQFLQQIQQLQATGMTPDQIRLLQAQQSQNALAPRQIQQKPTPIQTFEPNSGGGLNPILLPPGQLPVNETGGAGLQEGTLIAIHKELRSQGIDPNSAEGQQRVQQEVQRRSGGATPQKLNSPRPNQNINALGPITGNEAFAPGELFAIHQNLRAQGIDPNSTQGQQRIQLEALQNAQERGQIPQGGAAGGGNTGGNTQDILDRIAGLAGGDGTGAPVGVGGGGSGGGGSGLSLGGLSGGGGGAGVGQGFAPFPGGSPLPGGDTGGDGGGLGTILGDILGGADDILGGVPGQVAGAIDGALFGIPGAIIDAAGNVLDAASGAVLGTIGGVLGGGGQGNAGGGAAGGLGGALGDVLGGILGTQGGIGGILASPAAAAALTALVPQLLEAQNESRGSQTTTQTNTIPGPSQGELQLAGINIDLAREALSAYQNAGGQLSQLSQASSQVINQLVNRTPLESQAIATDPELRQQQQRIQTQLESQLGRNLTTDEIRSLRGDQNALNSVLASEVGRNVTQTPEIQQLQQRQSQLSDQLQGQIGQSLVTPEVEAARNAQSQAQSTLQETLARGTQTPGVVDDLRARQTEVSDFAQNLLGDSLESPEVEALRQQQTGNVDALQQQLGDGVLIPEIVDDLRGRQSSAFDVLQGSLENQGIADPGTLARIREISDLATQSGLSDLNKFQADQLDQIRLASADRGLRPSDTPILNQFGDVAQENSRQAQQLISGLRQQQLLQELQFPLQQAASTANSFSALSAPLQQQLATELANPIAQGQLGLQQFGALSDATLQQLSQEIGIGATQQQLGQQGASALSGSIQQQLGQEQGFALGQGQLQGQLAGELSDAALQRLQAEIGIPIAQGQLGVQQFGALSGATQQQLSQALNAALQQGQLTTQQFGALSGALQQQLSNVQGFELGQAGQQTQAFGALANSLQGQRALNLSAAQGAEANRSGLVGQANQLGLGLATGFNPTPASALGVQQRALQGTSTQQLQQQGTTTGVPSPLETFNSFSGALGDIFSP